MNKIMKFENTPIDVQVINSVPMFELYSVGMALGYARSNGKSGGEHSVHPENKKLFPYKSRIDKVVKNAEIKPVLRNAKPYITESQLYDLMLEARTDKCRAFRKWLTNEVLPELNHTGTYSLKKEPKQDKQLTFYEYFDKKWDGRIVMTIEDISHFVDIAKDSIRYCIKTYGKEGEDYYLLKKAELAKFKFENPKANKFLKGITVITRSGFELICKWYGIKIDYPDAFLRDMFSKRKAIEPPKEASSNSKPSLEEREIAAEELWNKFDRLVNLRVEKKIKNMNLPAINMKDYDAILLIHK